MHCHTNDPTQGIIKKSCFYKLNQCVAFGYLEVIDDTFVLLDSIGGVHGAQKSNNPIRSNPKPFLKKKSIFLWVSICVNYKEMFFEFSSDFSRFFDWINLLRSEIQSAQFRKVYVLQCSSSLSMKWFILKKTVIKTDSQIFMNCSKIGDTKKSRLFKLNAAFNNDAIDCNTRLSCRDMYVYVSQIACFRPSNYFFNCLNSFEIQ